MGLTFAQIQNTPVGTLSFVAGDEGLQGVAFTSLNALKQSHAFPLEAPSLQGLEILGTLLVEMNAYLTGIQKFFSVGIDWGVLDGFPQEVLALTAEIPYGQVVTYAALAESLGKPGAARAVGSALSRNPMPIVIPCHRVVGSDYALRGYIGGEQIKAFLLALEGHAVVNFRLARS